MNKLRVAVLMAVAGISVCRADVGAQADEDKLKFTSPTFYLWASGLEGDVTMAGQTVPVDVGFDKLFEHTDLGWSGYFELEKGPFGAYLQPNYMALSAEGDLPGPLGNATIEQRLWIVEGALQYRFWQSQGEHPWQLTALAGLRWWNNQFNIKIKGGTLGGFEAARSGNLYDPTIGLRVEKYVTDKLHFRIQGDVGGFDIGHDTSNFAWQILPTVGYDFTLFNKPFTPFIGYRCLASEFESGSGKTKNGANFKMQGFLVGFNWVIF